MARHVGLFWSQPWSRFATPVNENSAEEDPKGDDQ
jgi:hypothetical protein